MELETEDTAFILINRNLQWFEERLFGFMGKQLFLIDFVYLDELCSKNPKVSIWNVSSSFRIEILPFFLHLLQLELVNHWFLLPSDLTVCIDNNCHQCRKQNHCVNQLERQKENVTCSRSATAHASMLLKVYITIHIIAYRVWLNLSSWIDNLNHWGLKGRKLY